MISVAIAYYNGGKYINEQLDSILCQLGEKDEVIISVDKAEDGSLPMLLERAERDCRIRLLEGPGKGVISNFENAMKNCRGDVIFLSDQDDIWEAHKVRKVLWAMKKSGAACVLHNAVQIDGHGHIIDEPDLFTMRSSNSGIIKNLVKNSYMGCCMAFHSRLLSVIFPIPKEAYMHDYWIGTAAEMNGGVALIREPLLRYRRHGENVTNMHHGSAAFMMKKRLDLLKCLIILKKRSQTAAKMTGRKDQK